MAAAASFSDTPLQQPLIILATADEESSMNGARALAAAGKPKARAAIIGEPTSLVPVRMHKGIMMEAVHITGQAGHSSNPTLGNSALEGMHIGDGRPGDFPRRNGERYSNPLFEVAYPTLNLGCIHGGDSPNRICGQKRTAFRPAHDTRQGTTTQVREEFGSAAHIGQHGALDIECVPDTGCVVLRTGRRQRTGAAWQNKLTGHSAKAVAFATEAPFLQQLGMDTIVMGPGSIDQAHQPDEFMPTGPDRALHKTAKEMHTALLLVSTCIDSPQSGGYTAPA